MALDGLGADETEHGGEWVLHESPPPPRPPPLSPPVWPLLACCLAAARSSLLFLLPAMLPAFARLLVLRYRWHQPGAHPMGSSAHAVSRQREPGGRAAGGGPSHPVGHPIATPHIPIRLDRPIRAMARHSALAASLLVLALSGPLARCAPSAQSALSAPHIGNWLVSVQCKRGTRCAVSACCCYPRALRADPPCALPPTSHSLAVWRVHCAAHDHSGPQVRRQSPKP